MKLIEFENILPVDVDETLITEVNPSNKNGGYMLLQYGETARFYSPCHKNIALMKHHKQTRGYGIIVWSANGKEWAQKVVKRLELEEYVDYIATKPKEYLDDKPVSSWMPCQIHLGVE